MKCPTCGIETAYIKCSVAGCVCHNCGGFSEAGGTKTDGLLTRNSLRVRSDSLKYEGDTLPPHEYDKSSGDWKPRADFVKRFPKEAKEQFSQKELNDAGYNKLKSTK